MRSQIVEANTKSHMRQWTTSIHDRKQFVQITIENSVSHWE